MKPFEIVDLCFLVLGLKPGPRGEVGKHHSLKLRRIFGNITGRTLDIIITIQSIVKDSTLNPGPVKCKHRERGWRGDTVVHAQVGPANTRNRGWSLRVTEKPASAASMQ